MIAGFMRKLLWRMCSSGTLVFISFLACAQRLPRNIEPEHYQLTFAPDLQNEKFTGEEAIDVRVLTHHSQNIFCQPCIAAITRTD